jgi:hypothetical protein
MIVCQRLVKYRVVCILLWVGITFFKIYIDFCIVHSIQWSYIIIDSHSMLPMVSNLICNKLII